jgi:hypothetical protein
MDRTAQRGGNVLNSIEYAAIRRCSDDGHEWIDTSTISGSHELARAEAKQNDDFIVAWAKHNPVVRIAQIKIEEMEGK